MHDADALNATRQPAAREAPTGPVVLTVHGTNDADTVIEGKRWWQIGSAFEIRLSAELVARGIAGTEIRPVQWTGQNSDFDRLAAARKLAAAVRKVQAEGRPYAVIGHSHGGNVVMEGLTRVSKPGRLSGVVTFGTPFFSRELKTVPWLIALFKILLGVTMVPIMLLYLVTVLGMDTNKKIDAWLFFGGIAVAAAWAFVSGLKQLMHRGRAGRRLGRVIAPDRWLVIHSPRDEAMRLLETAGVISPRYVTTASATRALTAFAALTGVVVTIGVFAKLWWYFLEPVVTKIKAGQLGLATAADLTFVLLIPVVYGAVFGLVYAIARLGGGWLYGRFLSRAIHGGVIGAAYGGDGPYRLTGVGRVPPYMPDVAQNRIEAVNLGGIDDAAVFDAARKLYDGVVAADAPEGGIGDPDLMWKRLSDALYHNAYMRDAEVIARVADHLATGWRSPGAP